jgi:DNA-binding response OmpR family regulator
MDERPSIGSPKWKEGKSVGIERMDMNSKTLDVHFNGRSEHLTKKEFQVLWLLNRANGGLVDRGEIEQFLYEDADKDSPLSNTIEAFISRVRKKIEGSGFVITNMDELGYKLEKTIA